MPEIEASVEVLENLSRVTPSQWKFVQFKPDSRYEPVKKGPLTAGILIFRDKTPQVAEDIIPYTTPCNDCYGLFFMTLLIPFI